MPRSISRADLITSAVGLMIRFNYPATRESVYRALGTDCLPVMCDRAGYGEDQHCSARAMRMLVMAILRKLCDMRGIVMQEAAHV